MPVNIIDTLKPKNNGTFPVVEAIDVAVTKTKRLPEVLDSKATTEALEHTNTVVASKASTADLNAAANNLQAQIDAIVAPATQEAEVQNSRVGVNGTSYSTLKERLDTENVDLKNAYSQNIFEVISTSERSHNDRTINELTFSWIDYKTCHITGNGNGTVQTYPIYIDNTKLPFNMSAGKTYLLNIKGAVNCHADIFTVNVSGGENWRSDYTKIKSSTFITIPADAVGLFFRIGAWGITSAIDETLEISIVAVPDELIPIVLNRYVSVSERTSFDSLNDISDSCVVFISSDHDEPSIPDAPIFPAYALTICYSELIKLQILYPYNNGVDKAVYRNCKRGTWSSWTTFLDEKDFPKLVQSLGVYAFDDADKINVNSIIFVSSTAGQPTMQNTPVFPCWVETVGVETNLSNIASQVCYPYDDAKKLYRRVKKRGTWSSWSEISGEGGGTVTIEQEVSRDTYNNTYNITTSPVITTDSNGWLQAVDTDTESETDKTDMTGAIMSMLNDTGYCHLSEGIFYVSGGIDLPKGATLEGCGKNTIIRLLSSVESGYICRVKEYATVKGITFSGGYAQGDISTPDIGGRKGIIAIGNRDGQTPSITPATIKCCQISNCWFENLDSGIYGYNSGGGLNEGLVVSDCYITRCKAGINLDYWVEYCKFTNVVTFQCYYACINNGGNNTFTACTFHGVIGMYIDNSAGSKTNIAHGSVVGCTFNHIDNMNHPETLGNGYAVKVLNVPYGFIFTGCQIWYGKVYVESSQGVQFSDTLFGGYPTIETLGEDTVFFSSCIFQKAVVKSLSSPVIFNNCYLFNGTQVSA